jgi:sortase A
MNAVQNHLRNRLRWLETLLWIAGFVALGYCALVVVETSITQARLARSLKQAREVESREAVTTEAHGKEAVNTPDRGAGPAANGLLGRLEVPRIGLSAMVLEGVGPQTLRVAVGHVLRTPEPGQPGNIALAGHRDTFFRPLRQIEVNDEIRMDTPSRILRYRVSSTEVVDPHDTGVLKPHHKNELTLITCYPFSYIGAAPKRFIVHADLIGCSGINDLRPESCRVSRAQ